MEPIMANDNSDALTTGVLLLAGGGPATQGHGIRLTGRARVLNDTAGANTAIEIMEALAATAPFFSITEAAVSSA